MFHVGSWTFAGYGEFGDTNAGDGTNWTFSMSSYYGVSGGLTGDSVLRGVVQSALAASQAKGRGSTVLRTFNAMQGAYQLGTGLSDAVDTGFSKLFSFPGSTQASGSGGSDDSSNGSSGGSLVGVSVSFDMSKTRSHSEQEQSTVLGSTVTAGNRLSIVACGDHPGLADDGSISATAAQLAAKDISLDAKNNIDLEAGWNRQSALNHTTQKGLSVGVEASVGTSGVGFSLSASGQMQRTNMESHQATAADTVLNATNSVSLTSGGKTTLKGAEVSAPRIDVKAAELEITSPQNTSDYRSTAMQATAGVKIPLYGAATGGASASYQNQKTTDHFASTGKVLSGLYAGDQGIGIDVSGNTSLTAGVISSTASREKNHFNTGSLEAYSLENNSAWQSQSVGFQAGAGSGMLSGSITKIMTSFGTGMAANSMSMLGGNRSHDERSESQSAISDNITVNAGHVTGSYSRDVDHANGALTNKFDAQKLQNQIRASQLGTQLVGEVMGRVSDTLYSHGVQGFDEHSATNNWGRAILEAGGSAAVAAVTGGNVAATATSVFAGTIASGATRDWADRAATALTGQPTDARSTQAKLHDSLMNLLSNGIASAAGAAGGLVAGLGNATANALNGASAASAFQQYNQAFGRVLGKVLPRAVGLLAGKASEEVIEGSVEDVEIAINKYGRELFEPVDQGISRGIRQIGDILGSAISYGQRLSDVNSGTTSVTSQNAGSVISSPAQAQMLKDYIFSAPVRSDFSIPLGTGTGYAGTKTDETGAVASPSWYDNVLMAKRPKLGKEGSNNSAQNVSSSGGAGSGGQEPDDEESKQRKIREDSNNSPALKDSPYNPEAVDERVEAVEAFYGKDDGDELELEGVHFPWLTGPGGDFIGREGRNEGIREILTDEPSEEFAKKFYSDTVAWLEKSGLPLKPGSDRVIDQAAVDRGRATARFRNTYKMGKDIKKKRDVYFGWRSSGEASFRTSNGIQTIDVGHPYGNMRFKIIHVDK